MTFSKFISLVGDIIVSEINGWEIVIEWDAIGIVCCVIKIEHGVSLDEGVNHALFII